jgi:hypothetical protein
MKSFRLRYSLYAGIAVLIIMLCGCATTKGDWRDANKKDTIAGYEQFIKKHPQTSEAESAKKQIERLHADQDWKAAQTAGTIAAYQSFLSSYPDSTYTAQAKNKLEQLEAERDWKSAQAVNSIAAYKEYLAKHPKSHDDSQANKIIEEMEAAADWQKIEVGGTIEAYQNYYYSHTNSKYAGDALSRMNQMKAENDWKNAKEKNTEDVWVNYIVKYTSTTRADEACRYLRKHIVVRKGGLIPWKALGGKSWSQTDPSRDGFSNLEGAILSGATVMRLPNYYALECNDNSVFFFNHWVKLNQVKCIGNLRANAKGFTVVSGMALIPKADK